MHVAAFASTHSLTARRLEATAGDTITYFLPVTYETTSYVASSTGAAALTLSGRTLTIDCSQCVSGTEETLTVKLNNITQPRIALSIL